LFSVGLEKSFQTVGWLQETEKQGRSTSKATQVVLGQTKNDTNSLNISTNSELETCVWIKRDQRLDRENIIGQPKNHSPSVNVQCKRNFND